MNWKTSILLTGITIVGMAIFVNTKFALAMAALMSITFVSSLLSKWVFTKTEKPIYSGGIMFIGLALAMGSMKWFTSDNRTIWVFLKEVRNFLLMMGIPGATVLLLYGLTVYWKKNNPPNVPSPSEKDIPQLEKEFQKWYWRGTGLLFVGSIVFGYITYLLLKAFGSWYYSNLIEGVIVEPADSAMWGLVALFLGIYLSMLAINLLMKYFLGENYEKQKAYYDFRMGFNNKKAGVAIGLLYAVIVIGLIFINLTLYTRFTETEIAIHRPYWITEHIHSYTEIRSIQKITTVNRKSEGNVFVIEFSDGTSWKTTSYHTGEIPTYYPAILELASSKSNISVEYIIHDVRK